MKVVSFYGLVIFAIGGNAKVHLTDTESGEVSSLSLTDGRHDLSSFQQLLPRFEAFLSGCYAPSRDEWSTGDIEPVGYGSSAASPTYTPTEAQRTQRMVEQITRQVSATMRKEEAQRRRDAQSAREFTALEAGGALASPAVPVGSPEVIRAVDPPSVAKAVDDVAAAS